MNNTYTYREHYSFYYISRVGRGCQKLVFATGFNRFKPAGGNHQWKKLAKTSKNSNDQTVVFSG